MHRLHPSEITFDRLDRIEQIEGLKPRGSDRAGVGVVRLLDAAPRRCAIKRRDSPDCDDIAPLKHFDRGANGADGIADVGTEPYSDLYGLTRRRWHGRP